MMIQQHRMNRNQRNNTTHSWMKYSLLLVGIILHMVVVESFVARSVRSNKSHQLKPTSSSSSSSSSSLYYNFPSRNSRIKSIESFMGGSTKESARQSNSNNIQSISRFQTATTRWSSQNPVSPSALFVSSSNSITTATDLPDSLTDAAIRAAEATLLYQEQFGSGTVSTRCRIDFDTSIGDETYSILKTSTEFMQQYVSALCYALIPNLQQQRQDEMLAVVKAQNELRTLREKQPLDDEENDTSDEEQRAQQEDILLDIISRNGRPSDYRYQGPKVRIYFPDEGNAAYAKQNWLGLSGTTNTVPKVPPCCEFSSCGGVPVPDITKDQIILFFCPKASESTTLEAILQRAENQEDGSLQMTIFVNPNLVDMGVTGFGMAGRMLRERLLDQLMNVYYLRTLPWGAITRQYPFAYTVWQEDTNDSTGYRLLENLPYLPSNPEVEDIYDIANGIQERKSSGGLLDQFGDFVNGMMRL